MTFSMRNQAYSQQHCHHKKIHIRQTLNTCPFRLLSFLVLILILCKIWIFFDISELSCSQILRSEVFPQFYLNPNMLLSLNLVLGASKSMYLQTLRRQMLQISMVYKRNKKAQERDLSDNHYLANERKEPQTRRVIHLPQHVNTFFL